MTFLIKDASKYVNQTATVMGWVFNKRSSGAIVFLQIRDGSGFIQAVASKNEVPEKVFQVCQDIADESSVAVSGIIKEDKRSPFGYEMQIQDLKIISLSETDYPISPKEHGIDFLLNWRHLWLRSQRQWAIMRIRQQIINAINEFLQKNEYLRFDSPILTPSACEGTTTLFPVPYLPSWPALANEAAAGKPEMFRLSEAGFWRGDCHRGLVVSSVARRRMDQEDVPDGKAAKVRSSGKGHPPLHQTRDLQSSCGIDRPSLI